MLRRFLWLPLLAAMACGDKSPSPPTTPTPPPSPTDPILYTALGASDAIAIGASVSCLPLIPCPNGTGYVQIMTRELQATRQVTVLNLGFPAAVIGPDIQRLGRAHGRDIPSNFLEFQVPFVLRNSTLVTIFAGGNDANAIGAAVEGGAGGADPRAFMDAQVRVVGADYDAMIRGIRARAPSARIIVANLPNFAAIPFTAAYTLQRRQVMQRLSVGISTTVINPLASQNVTVVDLLCDDRIYSSANFSSDGYHPNDRGYALLAERYLAAFNAPSWPAPAASCAQMQVVPAL